MNQTHLKYIHLKQERFFLGNIAKRMKTHRKKLLKQAKIYRLIFKSLIS